ncbi:FUSC family protein [Georgenia sp. MJ170]|uniref:FUSC family protein n=1 Tax=Georgenia sunbinii TaxID=3117728 RepID=UPI002F25F050
MSAEERSERTDLRRWGVRIRLRARQGARRVQASAFPVLTAAIAAGLAWGIAHYWLGHSQPFFAPVATWVCLGFSSDRQVRKVAELAIGVALGVALGELVAYFTGTGILQIVVVIVVGALMARFIDRGQMLTIQAGVQGIVIVALPAISMTDGITGRWTDALIGGACALVVAVATPGDARRRARQLAAASQGDLARMLRTLASGLRRGDAELVRDALAQGRGTQGVLDEWAEVVRNALQSARISPTARMYVPELARMQRASMLSDRAMRNARVIARRGLVAVQDGSQDEEIAAALERLANGATMLGAALSTGGDVGSARGELVAAVPALDPAAFSRGGWQLQTLVILMRSLTVDLLQASGMSAMEATQVLAADS